MFPDLNSLKASKKSTAYEYRGSDAIYELIFGLLQDRGEFPPRKIVVSQFPWQQMWDVIRREKIGGFLYYELARDQEKMRHFPSWLYEELRRCDQENQRRNAEFSVLLRELLAGVHAAEIPVLIMRSEALLGDLYPAGGIRPFTDVDVIIPGTAFEHFQQTMNAMGYYAVRELPHIFRRGDMEIDVHCDGASNWRIDFWSDDVAIQREDVWNRAVLIDPRYPLVKKLSLYDEIIVECGHLQEHSYQSLIWFLDVRQHILRAAERFDWPMLLQRARGYALSIPVYFVLQYLHGHHLQPVPPEILKTLRERPLTRLEHVALQRLMMNQRELLSGELLYCEQVPGFFGKLCFIWRLAALDRRQSVVPEYFRRLVLAQRFFGMFFAMRRKARRLRRG